MLHDIPARVGIYAEDSDGRTLTYRADEMFPMLSTFKIPVAISVLKRTEVTHTPLSHRIAIAAGQMRPDTYSPMLKRHPQGWFDATIDSLLSYAVSMSDNNACDILIDYAGGIKAVAKTIEQAGIYPMTISATEEDMHRDIDNQRINVCSPRAAAYMLGRLANGELLTLASTEALIRHMTRTETGIDKLHAGLPQHIVMAHKTGSSDRTPQGIKIADNDIGIVFLPDGRSYIITVFIADSGLDDKANAALTAEISRIVYEAFSEPHKDK